MEAKEQLENPDVGARVKREYGEMFTEWQAHYEEALDNIQKYYIEYYTRTSKIYEGTKFMYRNHIHVLIFIYSYTMQFLSCLKITVHDF